MHQKRWHRATGFALHVEVLEDRQVLSATTVLQAPILLGPVHLGPAELSVTDDVLRPLVRLTESLPANGLGIVRSLLGNSLNIPGVPIHLNAGLQVLPISRLGTNALVNVADVPLDLSTNPSTNAKPEVGLGLFLNLGAEDGLDLPVDTNPPGGTSIDTHAGGEGVASPGAGILPGQNSATNLPPPLAFTPPLADGLPDLAFFANPPAGDLGLAGSVGALPVDTPVTLNLAGSSATDPDMLENDSTPASPLTSGLLVEAVPFDRESMEIALQQFLHQLAELRQSMNDAIISLGPWPWLFMGFAVATVLEEILRRSLRRVQGETNRSRVDALNRFPGPFNLKEEA